MEDGHHRDTMRRSGHKSTTAAAAAAALNPRYQNHDYFITNFYLLIN